MNDGRIRRLTVKFQKSMLKRCKFLTKTLGLKYKEMAKLMEHLVPTVQTKRKRKHLIIDYQAIVDSTEGQD